MEPTATCDCSTPITAVEACPLPEYERCILAGGENLLRLLGAHASESDSVSLRPLPSVTLSHKGALDAVAWGHEPMGGSLFLAAAGGELNDSRLHVVS